MSPASFYQLIPQEKFKTSAIRAMTDESEIKSQMQIMVRLADLQIAVKMLLGNYLLLLCPYFVSYCLLYKCNIPTFHY
jgi:hypothetical protein